MEREINNSMDNEGRNENMCVYCKGLIEKSEICCNNLTCIFMWLKDEGLNPDITRLSNGKFRIVVKGGNRRQRKNGKGKKEDTKATVI